MPPQTLQQRLTRLLSDASDPATDVHARWAKIVEDGVGAEAAALFGGIPEPSLDDVEPEKAIQYAARDADATLRIYPILLSKVRELGLEQALSLDESVIPIIVRMQQNGMLVDQSHLSVLNEVFTDTLIDLEYRAHTEAGHTFNLSSGDQVAQVLFDELSLNGRRRTKSGKRYTTDDKALQGLKSAHPIVAIIDEHREVSKLRSSYTEVLPRLISSDGRIRMELGLTTVPSGRLNCWGGVNLLAIPVRTALGKEIRRCFVAPAGCSLWSVDLNQAEMRAMAIISGDERMLEAFSTGIDIHTQTASLMFKTPMQSVTPEQRHHGKQVGFGIINGITAVGLYDQMILRGATDWDEVRCQSLIDLYLTEVYPGVGNMFQATWEEGRRNGYIRDSLSGRILWTPGLRSPIEKVRSESERVATNWKIQTFAQVLIKMGMAKLWEFLQSWWESGFERLEPLLQVHDEIVGEASNEIEPDMLGETLVELVTGAAPPLPIPIEASCHFAADWASLK